MLLTINALANDVDFSDPFPAEGLFDVHVAKGTSGAFSISPGQMYRVSPLLKDLEARVDVTTKAPVMTWTVTADSTNDLRAQAGASTLSIFSANPGTVSVGSGNAAVQIKGAGFLTGVAKAVATVGVGAGSVVYTAVTPGALGNSIQVVHKNNGASVSLTVGVVGNVITVNLGTNSSSVVTSTAANVVTAIAASAPASLLVLSTVGTAGTAQAVAVQNLLGGTGPAPVVTVNGVVAPITSVAAGIITLPVTTAQLVGTASGNMTRLTVSMGQAAASIDVLVGA